MRVTSIMLPLGLGLLVCTVGCKKGGPSGSGDLPAGAVAPPAGGGPTVTVPAGQLVAGSACDAIPRITTEELVAVPVEMTEFSIDVYPYPNDPAKAPVTGVTRDDAAKMCEAEGKRLCTELEWERACKGPKNQTFEYGNGYQPGTCAPASPPGGPPGAGMGKRAGCISGFGARDLHGLVFEWTDSAWGRGTSGGLAAVRGGFSPAADLVARCANGQGRAPSDKAANVGFRCCGGARNRAEVNLSLSNQPPMVQEPAVDANLAKQMMAALPQEMRTVPNAAVSFDQVWRWHPRANEELIIARWLGKPQSPPAPAFYEETVFKICHGAPHLLAHMKGPVEEAQNPATGADAQKATVRVRTGTDQGELKLEYRYGRVPLDQPAWIKAGNTLAVAGPPAADAGVVQPMVIPHLTLPGQAKK